LNATVGKTGAASQSRRRQAPKTRKPTPARVCVRACVRAGGGGGATMATPSSVVEAPSSSPPPLRASLLPGYGQCASFSAAARVPCAAGMTTIDEYTIVAECHNELVHAKLPFAVSLIVSALLLLASAAAGIKYRAWRLRSERGDKHVLLWMIVVGQLFVSCVNGARVALGCVLNAGDAAFTFFAALENGWYWGTVMYGVYLFTSLWFSVGPNLAKLMRFRRRDRARLRNLFLGLTLAMIVAMTALRCVPLYTDDGATQLLVRVIATVTANLACTLALVALAVHIYRRLGAVLAVLPKVAATGGTASDAKRRRRRRNLNVLRAKLVVTTSVVVVLGVGASMWGLAGLRGYVESITTGVPVDVSGGLFSTATSQYIAMGIVAIGLVFFYLDITCLCCDCVRTDPDTLEVSTASNTSSKVRESSTHHTGGTAAAADDDDLGGAELAAVRRAAMSSADAAAMAAADGGGGAGDDDDGDEVSARSDSGGNGSGGGGHDGDGGESRVVHAATDGGDDDGDTGGDLTAAADDDGGDVKHDNADDAADDDASDDGDGDRGGGGDTAAAAVTDVAK